MILRKIIKTVATRCQILRLKCTKFDFGGSLQRSPDPLAGFKGPTSKGRVGKGGRGGEEREEEGREKDGKRGEGNGGPTYNGREVKGRGKGRGRVPGYYGFPPEGC